MHKLLFCLVLTCAGIAHADPLADANALLATKSYPKALEMFTALAAAGSADAQLRLGEMYWYGEGVALDRAKGDALFGQAAAKGAQGANEALRLSGQRQARLADIAWWSARYDGADLTSGKYDCAPPVIPARSTTNDDIVKTNAADNAWRVCYNAFVANVANAMPPGKRIPADVLELMSEAEVAQARDHLGKVYAAVLEEARVRAASFVVRRNAWEQATAAYVEEQNKARTKMHVAEMEAQQRNRQFARDSVFITAPPKR